MESNINFYPLEKFHVFRYGYDRHVHAVHAHTAYAYVIHACAILYADWFVSLPAAAVWLFSPK